MRTIKTVDSYMEYEKVAKELTDINFIKIDNNTFYNEKMNMFVNLVLKAC